MIINGLQNILLITKKGWKQSFTILKQFSKKKGKGTDEDELGVDEDFKEMDLFNDSSFDDEEDDF